MTTKKEQKITLTFKKETEPRVINRKLTKGAIYSICRDGQPVGRIIWIVKNSQLEELGELEIAKLVFGKE